MNKKFVHLYATCDDVFTSVQHIFDNTWDTVNIASHDDRQTKRPSSLQVTEVLEMHNEEFANTYRKRWEFLKKNSLKQPGGRYQKLEETNSRPILTDGLDTEYLNLPKEACDQDIIEVYLFYCAKKKVLDKVFQFGFSVEEAKSGIFGDAVNLAESPQLADFYAGTATTPH